MHSADLLICMVDVRTSPILVLTSTILEPYAWAGFRLERGLKLIRFGIHNVFLLGCLWVTSSRKVLAMHRGRPGAHRTFKLSHSTSNHIQHLKQWYGSKNEPTLPALVSESCPTTATTAECWSPGSGATPWLRGGQACHGKLSVHSKNWKSHIAFNSKI